jgi:hypothetical protein
MARSEAKIEVLGESEGKVVHTVNRQGAMEAISNCEH